MRIDSHTGVRGKLYADLGKGLQYIPCVVWYDLEEKEFLAYRVGPLWKPFTPGAGKYIVRVDGEKQTWGHKGCDMRFVADDVQSRIALNEMVRKAEPVKVVHRARITLPDPRRRCEGYACDRPVAWYTLEERTEPPAVIGGQKYDCASFVRTRYWCSFCYEPPLILDSKGEVVQVYDEILARPT